VTRTLRAVSGDLAVGTKVALDSAVYAGNPQQALGMRFANVEVPGELGPMPAWLIPGSTHTWTLVVHGINGDREDNLRIVPTLHSEGLPTMLITYREDVGAPRSPDGFHHMGLTEWRDLQAAARYAIAHGAQHLVVIGYSMGGAIVTQFMERSPLARRVIAMVLDAPALSWTKILQFNAKEIGFPSFGALPVEWAVGLRIDANWDQLEALDHIASFHLPTLLFHGLEDKTVPMSLSDEFARSCPAGSPTTVRRMPGMSSHGTSTRRFMTGGLRRFLRGSSIELSARCESRVARPLVGSFFRRNAAVRSCICVRRTVERRLPPGGYELTSSSPLTPRLRLDLRELISAVARSITAVPRLIRAAVSSSLAAES
jgi:pimeloyl-ACP methyl ester carboxylesterase